jgi:hypothetical protein
MPATRITPAQLFALAVIWSAVAYGVVAKETRSTSMAQVETARLVACR